MRTDIWLLWSYLPAALAAFGAKPPPRPDGVPSKLENFRWADPFGSRRIQKLAASCEAEQTFSAREYLLDDLQAKPPLGLAAWKEGLKKIFAGREYPGSWDGVDPHGYDRNLLLMEYAAVPLPVREWIEHQERSDGAGKGLFAVYEKPSDARPSLKNVVRFPAPEMAAGLRPLDQKRVVIFAPGALYDILPLWTADGSDCRESLLDLEKYSPKPTDGAVVAWTSYTKASRSDDDRNMTFTVKAQLLAAKEGEAEGGRDEGGKDEL